MQDTTIAPGVKYVGVDDTTLDLFEGQYRIPNGISYNSYIIDDDKIAVLDTVDARATDHWLANLKDVLGDRTPDYLIIHHVEPDHGANIKRLLDMYPQCTAICSEKAVKMLARFFGDEIASRLRGIHEGYILRLGAHTLQFFMAPMVHWPEVMVSYEQTDKIFFSADSFGKFGALSAEEDWADEARRYYINIVGKYGASVQALLKKTSDLDIRIICPLHGPILKGDLAPYFSLYDTWSSYRPEKEGVLIAYGTLHGNTAKGALALADMIRESAPGTEVKVCDLMRTDMSEAIADAFRYDRLVLASPTYDGGLMPVVEDFLNHLRAKAYQKRKYAVIENGSWAPVAGKKIREQLDSFKDMIFVEPQVTIESTVKDKTLADLRTLAANIAGE